MYPVKNAKYAGEDRAAKISCRAEGGGVKDWESKAGRAINDAMVDSAHGLARGMNNVSRSMGLPYNKGALGVQQNDDMNQAESISDAVPRRKD